MPTHFFTSGDWLPFTFALLIGVSLLLYAILDGYDLGVGLLSRWVEPAERDRMIASIGPFWDANETWLVLGVGLLLVAFPMAHGIVLSELYLPVSLMLLGLIFRGVSFDFRKKVAPEKQALWNQAFFYGSLTVALCQGYMVGRFMTGFQSGLSSQLFAIAFGLLTVTGYTLMGASWLIYKCESTLQRKAIRWAWLSIHIMVLGAILSSLAALFVDTRIYTRMLSFPELGLLILLPWVTLMLTCFMRGILKVLPLPNDRLAWMPLAISISIFVLGFSGLVYSFYPYIIPGHLKITEAAAAPESLLIILLGTALVFPILMGYTALAYHIFRGKAQALSYQ